MIPFSPHAARLAAAAACATLLLAAGGAATFGGAQPRADRAATDAAAGAPLQPLRPGASVYKITDGNDEGERIRLEIRRANVPEADREFWSYDFDEERAALVSQRTDGAVMLHQVLLRDAGYRLAFDRPLTLVPGDVRPGERCSETASVTAYETADGSVYGSGTAEHTVRDAGRSRIRTPAGTFDARMLRLEQRIDLGNVNVTITVLSGYVPGEGRVYQNFAYERQAYAIFGSTETMTIRLVERER